VMAAGWRRVPTPSVRVRRQAVQWKHRSGALKFERQLSGPEADVVVTTRNSHLGLRSTGMRRAIRLRPLSALQQIRCGIPIGHVEEVVDVVWQALAGRVAKQLRASQQAATQVQRVQGARLRRAEPLHAFQRVE
jgi:hypothetical protein